MSKKVLIPSLIATVNLKGIQNKKGLSPKIKGLVRLRKSGNWLLRSTMILPPGKWRERSGALIFSKLPCNLL